MSKHVGNGRDRSVFIDGTVTTVPYKRFLLSSLFQREEPVNTILLSMLCKGLRQSVTNAQK